MSTPVEPPVSSATYGFVRFIGGGLATSVAAKLVGHTNVPVPFLIGTATLIAATLVFATGRPLLAGGRPR
jgi:ACDE family multidrug resistance protein